MYLYPVLFGTKSTTELHRKIIFSTHLNNFFMSLFIQFNDFKNQQMIFEKSQIWQKIKNVAKIIKNQQN